MKKGKCWNFSTVKKNVDRFYFLKALIESNKIEELTRVVCDGYEWQRVGKDVIKTIHGSFFKWHKKKRGFWLYDNKKKEFYACGWPLALLFHEFE